MLKTKRDVLRLKSNLQKHVNQIDLLSDDYFNERINEQWNKLKIITAVENLKAMPVDTISTLEKRMPINAIVASGYDSIFDLKDKNMEDLMEIDGVGKVSALAIYDAVEKIKISVYKATTPRINPDQLTDEALAVLRAVYQKWKVMDKIAAIRPLIDLLYTEVFPKIEIAKGQKGMIGKFFQSRTEKRRIDAAFDQLNNQSNIRLFNNRVDKIINFTVEDKILIDHFINENASYYTEIENVTGFEPTNITDSLSKDIIEAVNDYPIDLSGLQIELRKYQLFGAKYALHYKRTLLGDEMGLGKTIQGLALINHLNENEQAYAIVVCPLSVLANWKREVESHSSLKTFIFHGSARDRELEKWKNQTGVLLTTYEHTLRLGFTEDQKVDALIVDEAHYIKNPNAKRSKSVYQLAEVAEYVLFMSGTPLENRLEEMQQLISVLQPAISHKISDELHLLEPQAFKELVAPVYLRRNRDQVLGELPELEIIPRWMDFGHEEKQYYHHAVQAGHLMKMRRAAWMGRSPEKSPKLQTLLEICEEARENGHKVLVFSFFRDVIQTIQDHLQGCTFEAITGDVANDRRQDIIDEFTAAEAGSVLVSQITAGGVGLNIQAASIVILCEPQWKPSTEEQAISRAYRMGQARNVIVYRLLTESSIDVSMLEVLGQKANIFDLYARESEVGSLHLNKAEELDEKRVTQQVLKMEQERLEKEVG